jgi:hypothetical protein
MSNLDEAGRATKGRALEGGAQKGGDQEGRRRGEAGGHQLPDGRVHAGVRGQAAGLAAQLTKHIAACECI